MDRPFEERILDFLEGDSPEHDDATRESLLREASESPEKRRTFAAFVRLRSILKTAQKPSAAPLELQRDLAQKLPVLALHLPYLASEEKRERAAAFWTSWTMPTRIAMSIALIALVGSGLFVSLRSTVHDSTHGGAETSTNPQAGASAMQNPNRAPLSTSSAEGVSPTRSSANETPNLAHRTSTHPHVGSNLNSGSTGATRSGSLASHGQRASRRPENAAIRPGAADVPHSELPADNGAPNSTNRGAASIEPSPTQGSANDTVASAQASSMAIQGDPKPTADFLAAQQQQSGVVFGVEPAARVQFLPNVSLAGATAQRDFGTASGVSIGGGLWLTGERNVGSVLTIGARVGYLRIAQMQSITYSEASPVYPLLRRYQRETRLRDTMALVFGPSLGIHLPIAGLDAECRVYAAVAPSDVHWMMGMDLGAEYPLSARFNVRGALGFDVISTAAAAPTGEVLPNAYTVGVRDVGTVPSSLVSPALALSIGISYRP